MTEQPRTIPRERVGEEIAVAEQATLDEVDRWLRDFLEL